MERSAVGVPSAIPRAGVPSIAAKATEFPEALRRAWYWVPVALMLGLLLGIAIANAREYPMYGGYDEVEHQRYSDLLVHHGHIPGREESVEFDSPPGFYAVAGVGTLIGEQLGMGDPWMVGRGLNVLWVLGAAVLVLLAARLVFPGRPAVHLAALGFACFVPVVLKVGAMFHPEPFSLFLSTAGLYVAARMLVRRDFGVRPAVLLGAVLGAAQLVRAFTLWTFVAVLLVFLAAALVRYAPRRAVLTAAAIAVAAAAAVAGPWYVRQAIEYSNPVVFDRAASGEPIWERRPAAFYTGLGLPEVFTDPIRPHYVNNVLPTLYSDIWGDYFGNYAWGAPTPPSPDVDRQLTVQSELGVVPTALALGGWLVLLAGSLRRREPARLLVALLPLLGLLGFLVFTVSYPSGDGDVLKATYLLTTVPGWALAFGFAVGSLARNLALRLALAVFLVGSLVLDLGFLIFQSPLAGAF